MEKWEFFAEVCFDAMNGTLHRWKNANPDTLRSMTRIFYDLVFSSGNSNPTEYISVEAQTFKYTKRVKPTKDHFLSPQFVARMIYDQPEIWLKDIVKFKQIFFLCCQTIQVSKKENIDLSKLTSNKHGEFIVYVPTHKKYEHLGIKLFHNRRGVSDVSEVFEQLVPKELIEYEKQYLVEQ